jgi:hypothetical protein
LAASDAISLVDLMAAELGVHPDNGKRLLAAGYVTLDGEKVRELELPADEARGRFLDVLGRQLRIEVPTRRLPPQGELF